MLSNIITGKFQSQLVIIEDSLDYSGHSLLRAFAHQIRNGQQMVHILCFENPIEKLNDWANSAVQFHDCFSNHRGWNNGEINFPADNKESSYKESNLYDLVQKVAGKSVGDFIVLIDSLSPALFTYGVARCYKDLHSLLCMRLVPGANLTQLICLLHEDLLPDRHSTISRLRHLATTYLQVEPPMTGTLGNAVVSVTHKKQGGKVIKKLEQYHVDRGGHVTSTDIQSATAVPAPVPVDPAVSVQELATFKLGLGQQEKEARSQLVLPYLRPEEKGGGGQVFYQPDAADDWDEEDPDDDLDV